MKSEIAVFERPVNPCVLPDPHSPFRSECLSSALELLEVLKTEEQILRRFAGAELVRLIPKKEYLVRELEWKLEAARETGTDIFMTSDSFKALLEDIEKVNASNGAFIEKSLSYWQDLLSIFSPPGYGRAGNCERRQPWSPKGMAFKRKI